MIGGTTICKTYAIKFVVFLASINFLCFLKIGKIVQLILNINIYIYIYISLIGPHIRVLSLVGGQGSWPKLPKPRPGLKMILFQSQFIILENYKKIIKKVMHIIHLLLYHIYFILCFFPLW